MAGGNSPAGDPFDDDVPWADPDIRKDYQAALGQFILLFNELDYHIGAYISAAMARIGVDTMLSRNGVGDSFAHRIPMFTVLARSDEQLSNISPRTLAGLNKHRNRLVHGHFDQNPFDGSYELLEKQKRRDYPIAEIARLARRLTVVIDGFRAAEAVREFEPSPPDSVCE